MKKLNEETEKTVKEEARPKEQSQRSEVFLLSYLSTVHLSTPDAYRFKYAI